MDAIVYTSIIFAITIAIYVVIADNIHPLIVYNHNISGVQLSKLPNYYADGTRAILLTRRYSENTRRKLRSECPSVSLLHNYCSYL